MSRRSRCSLEARSLTSEVEVMSYGCASFAEWSRTCRRHTGTVTFGILTSHPPFPDSQSQLCPPAQTLTSSMASCALSTSSSCDSSGTRSAVICIRALHEATAQRESRTGTHEEVAQLLHRGAQPTRRVGDHLPRFLEHPPLFSRDQRAARLSLRHHTYNTHTHTYRVLDVPLLRVVCDVLIELALQVLFLLLVELVLLVQPARAFSRA